MADFIYGGVFYIFAALTVLSASIVVFSRSLVYAAFSLLFTFFGVAGLYVFLGADFLAATQLILYVGGILVLLLFGVMLTHRAFQLEVRSETNQLIPALALAAAIFATIATIALKANWQTAPQVPLKPTTGEIGRLFMTDYILPFELASVLLCIAVMGAAMLLRRK